VSFNCQNADCMQTYFGYNEGLDEHDNAASHNGGEGYDVKAADNVKNDVAWASQVFC
jgi:hypothetical protein